MANARFLLRPRWILSHLFVIALVVVMVNLGFWQLNRLDERRDLNALIEARQDEAPVPLDSLVSPSSSADEVEAVRARPVTLSGTYDDAATVPARNRTQDGVAGIWVVTPLVLSSSGERVPVVRGFVALGPDGEPYPVPVPSGEVTVSGAVLVPRLQDRTVRRDLSDLLAEPDTLGVLVRAEETSPAEPSLATPDGDPRAALYPLPPPDLTERNHMSYAVQWFIFSAIALIGYPLVLRRVLTRRGKEAGAADDDADAGAGTSEPADVPV